MTTPDPMSVVEALEFLNSLARDCHAQNKLVRPAFILDKTQKALPLARSMQEKLERYDELVEKAEALEFLKRQYPAFFREVLLDMTYYHERAWPSRLKAFINDK